MCRSLILRSKHFVPVLIRNPNPRHAKSASTRDSQRSPNIKKSWALPGMSTSVSPSIKPGQCEIARSIKKRRPNPGVRSTQSTLPPPSTSPRTPRRSRPHSQVGDSVEPPMHDFRGNGVNDYSIWRPLFTPLEDNPLALCDYRTVSASDLVPTDLPSPHYEGELYHLHHNANHRWYFLHQMKREEALVIKCYDSEGDDGGSTIAKCTYDSHSEEEAPHTDRPPKSLLIRLLRGKVQRGLLGLEKALKSGHSSSPIAQPRRLDLLSGMELVLKGWLRKCSCQSTAFLGVLQKDT